MMKVSGTHEWTAGQQLGTGTTRVLGTATITGAGTKTWARTVENNGTLTWNQGQLNAATGMALLNNATFDWQGDLTIGNAGGGTITNVGTFQKTAGTGLSSITASVPFTNTGTLDVQTGTVNLAGIFTHNTGALITGSGTIDLPTTYTFDGDINPGTVGGVGILTFIGDLNLTANSNVTKRSNAWSLTSGAPNTRRETCAQVLAPPVIAVVWAITRSKLGMISRN